MRRKIVKKKSGSGRISYFISIPKDVIEDMGMPMYVWLYYDRKRKILIIEPSHA